QQPREPPLMSNPVPNVSRPAVIRVDPLAGRPSALMELFRAFPAWIISAGIHGLLFFLFWLLVKDTYSRGSDNKDKEKKTINTRIEDPDKKKDVLPINEDEGLDPSKELNYDTPIVDKDGVSVPGPPDPDADAGLVGGDEAAKPMNIAPPPGTGRGQGG